MFLCWMMITMLVMLRSCLIYDLYMNEQKKIPFSARHGVGEDAILYLMKLTPEVAQKVAELLKANPEKYREKLPNGEVKYKDPDLLRDARAALKAENNTK